MSLQGTVPDTPPEEKKRLLEAWTVIVQKECDDIIVEKDKKFSEYTALKNRVESWLYRRMRRINVLEKRLIARKAQLKEIQDELTALESPTNTP